VTPFTASALVEHGWGTILTDDAFIEEPIEMSDQLPELTTENKLEVIPVIDNISMLIGICHKCHSSGIEVLKTTVLISEVGATDIPLCEQCRMN